MRATSRSVLTTLGIVLALAIGLFVGLVRRSTPPVPSRTESSSATDAALGRPASLAVPPKGSPRADPSAESVASASAHAAPAVRPTRTIRVTGRVVGLEGLLPSGATAYVLDAYRFGSPVGEAPIAADGSFALDAVFEGPYELQRLVVGAWLRGRRRLEKDAESSGGAPVDVVLDATEGRRIAGLVVDAQDRPLAGFPFALADGPGYGADVAACASGDLRGLVGGVIAPVRTDGAGRFEVKGLVDAPTTEYFGLAGDPALWMEAVDRSRARQGADDLVFRVLPAYRVALRLVPTTVGDDPQTWTSNSLTFELESAVDPSLTSATIDGDPRAAIEVRGPRRDVAAALEWSLHLELNGHRPVTRPIALPSGRTEASFDVPVERLTAAETGRAVIETPFRTSDGKPAMPMVAILHEMPSVGTTYEYVEPKLRPDGAWEISLPVGVSSLRISAEGYLVEEFGAAAEVTITSGVETRVTPKFRPHGTVRVRVSPHPARDGWVAIRTRREGEKEDRGGNLEFFDGVAYVAAMPEGEWEVTCTIDGTARRARFRVTAGTETSVELVPGG